MPRPGWGDRRIAVQTSPDALAWRGPELLMQPDPLDPPQVQFRHARLYALRGAFHFLDALDVAMLADGKRVDTSLFDF